MFILAVYIAIFVPDVSNHGGENSLVRAIAVANA
jgi:hypothetical protein